MAFKHTYGMLVLENKETGDLTNYTFDGKMTLADIAEIVEEENPNNECECLHIGWLSGPNKKVLRKEINKVFKWVEIKRRKDRKAVKK